MNTSPSDVGVLYNKLYYLLNERQADIVKPSLECVWVEVSQTTQERQPLDLLLPEINLKWHRWFFVEQI